ncbi:hypothetical protein CLU85_2304 [Acidovorax sp. 69]|nr:hypothetical protein CLU85_2304 [Acidovorax sp. 69]
MPAGADWLVPDWPAPPGVFALCTTRTGGVSLPPYDSLNLGTHVGDDLTAVMANRKVLESALQAHTPGARAVFLNQVHGDGVALLDGHPPNGTEADACMAMAPGAVCTIMVADCLPVLFAHASGQAVAAAHAGWRGLAGSGGQGVLESVLKNFCAQAPVPSAPSAIKLEASASPNEVSGAQPYVQADGDPCGIAEGMLAWLGPCIGPQNFEVGAEVYAAFCNADAAAQACFVARVGVPGKFLCDLAGLARLRLQALGITRIYGNNSTPAWCTVTNTSRFFSHRRDSASLGSSGRFAACIWRG